MTATTPLPRFVRDIVAINALVFLAFGTAFWLLPAELARWLDIELTSADAFADLRAMYGGVPLSVGALFVLGLRRRSWLAPSLFLVMASSAGLASARIYSLVVSGVPSGLVLGLLASELVSFVWAAIAYRALGPDRSATAPAFGGGSAPAQRA